MLSLSIIIDINIPIHETYKLLPGDLPFEQDYK